MENDLIITTEPMTEKHVPEAIEIDLLCGTSTWPATAFFKEISSNRLAHYFVAKAGEEVIGFAGMWLILDETHITTIAVKPEFRRRGIARKLIFKLLERSIQREALWATLEVRESNEPAIKLYEKFGFTRVGLRKNYYSDNNESAVIMWLGDMRKKEVIEKIEEVSGEKLSCLGD